MNQASKSLSERPFGYLLAIIGGTACFPLGWVASPLVLFILNKQMKPKDGRTPNRFLVWTLVGIVAVPVNLIGTTLVLAPLLNRLIESNVSGCNDGSIEACKSLLDQRDVHSRVTNPRFASLKEEAQLLREKQEREEQEKVRQEAQEKERVMQKQKEAERAKILAKMQERERKELAEKARIQTENQEKVSVKFGVGDDVSAWLSRCAQAGSDSSSAYENPRPPIVTRILSYPSQGVKLIFVPRAPIGAPPPYSEWKLMGITDPSTHQPIEPADALKRMGNSCR